MRPTITVPLEIPIHMVTKKRIKIIDHNSQTIAADRSYLLQRMNRSRFIHHDITTVPKLTTVQVGPPMKYCNVSDENNERVNLEFLKNEQGNTFINTTY